MEDAVWRSSDYDNYDNVWYRAEYEMVDSYMGNTDPFNSFWFESNLLINDLVLALGTVFHFILEAELDIDKYRAAIEGDFALDDVVLHPGCV